MTPYNLVAIYIIYSCPALDPTESFNKTTNFTTYLKAICYIYNTFLFQDTFIIYFRIKN